MLLSLLLATNPADAFDHPAAKWIGGAVLFLLFTYPTLDKLYDRFFGGEKASLKAWQAKVDAEIAKFMPEGNIRDELKKLGGEIADNQGKIKTYHDAAESNYNAINQRTATLEQHNASLTLLPSQVQKLNTDHAVLASEVRTLAGNIDKLSDKQDAHFSKLMEAVSNLSYTRGELHGGQRRES